MRIAIATVAALVLGPLTCAAEPDCSLANRYLANAREQQTAADYGQAAELARRAADTCPSYGSYELLGEAQAHSLERSKRALAVDAFVAAADLAGSDAEKARTLFNYAQLLYRDGDPQNAYPLILSAKALEPADPRILSLAELITQRVNHPTEEQIRGGLWNSMYKPLHWKSGGDSSAAETSAAAASPAAAGAPRPAAVAAPRPSILIPIHFETSKTVVDAETRANVGVLARALADPRYGSQRFVFVGHADTRGNESMNVTLSQQRAEAIYQTVILLEPSLEGRIQVRGRGSAEPLDPAHTEAAYRINRRLQVLLN